MSILLSLLPIVLPIGLIFIKAIVDIVAKTSMADEAALQAFQAGGLYQTIAFIGHPIVALAISVLIAVYTLLPNTNARDTATYLEEGVTSAGIILLVTGAGGALDSLDAHQPGDLDGLALGDVLHQDVLERAEEGVGVGLGQAGLLGDGCDELGAVDGHVSASRFDRGWAPGERRWR